MFKTIEIVDFTSSKNRSFEHVDIECCKQVGMIFQFCFFNLLRNC